MIGNMASFCRADHAKVIDLFRNHFALDFQRSALKGNHFLLEASRDRAVGGHDFQRRLVDLTGFALADLHRRRKFLHDFLFIRFKPEKTSERAAEKSLGQIRPLGQRLFRHDDAGGDKFQVVAVEKQLVKSVLFSDQAV